MENKDEINIKEETALFSMNIPRCPECILISSLKLNYKEGKPIIN